MRDYEAIKEALTFYAATAETTRKTKTLLDAADAIEELLAAVPNWISVEERLPDIAEKVLTCNGDFVSENWLCTVASKVGRVNVWAYSEGVVTHWMPLPEPPKEVE